MGSSKNGEYLTIGPMMIINFGALGMAQDISPLHACRLSVHLGQ